MIAAAARRRAGLPRATAAAAAAAALAGAGALAWAGVSAGAALRSLAAGAASLALAALAGAGAVRRLAIPGLRPLERVLLAVAAGVALLGAVLLGLGAAGLLHRPLAIGAAAALALLGASRARAWRHARLAAREAGRALLGPEGPVLAACAVLFLAAAIGCAASPVLDWDSLMYHLRTPEQFLARGRVFLPPDSEHVAHVGAVHMLYALSAALGGVEGAVVISALVALLLAAAVHRAAASVAGSAAGRLAAAGVAGTTLIAFVAVTARVDVTLAFVLFAAHAALTAAARGRSPRCVLAAGLLAGTALAVKVQALPYLVPLGAWGLVLVARRRIPARLALGALGLAAAAAAPWLAKNGVLVGDPVSPLLRGHRLAAWLLDDPRVAAIAGEVRPDLLARAREPFGLAALLLRPGALSPEAEAAAYVWSPLLVGGVALAVLHRRTWGYALPALAYVVLLAAASPRLNLRYLAPALPALSVACAAAAAWLVARLRAEPLVPVLTLVALAPLARPVHDAFVRARAAAQDPLHRLAAAASARVPPDGRILMLYDARGRPFDREVVQDESAITWPLLARSGHAAECLAGLGFTHVLVDFGALAFYGRRAGAIPEVADGSLARFVDRCLVPEAQASPLVLFRLAGPGAAATQQRP
jgi:hypothetical protein